MRLLIGVQIEDMRGQAFVVCLVWHIEHDVDEVEAGEQGWRQVDVIHY